MRNSATGAEAIPDSRGINLFRADPDFAALASLYLPDDLARHLGPHFDRMGVLAGGELDEAAGVADTHPPELVVRSRRGEDVQHIAYHPSYRRLEQVAFGEFGLAAMSHRGGVLGWDAPMPPAAKYLMTYLYVQAEFGVCCPLSMTDSLTRTLRKFGSAELVERYLPALTSQDMDELFQGAMFMTEQGAGSDVAATSVEATPSVDGSWSLRGDKWFCSNTDAELAMVLARRADGPTGMKGVSLFLLPRVLPDGTPNAYRIVRLKDKMGTRSMASGEIALEGATAWLVGDPEAGFKQMADMVNNSRLSNGMRAAGLMRRAATEALFIAHRRQAFGRRLIEMPLMRRQLAKMIVPTEQARSMMLQTAVVLQRADGGDAQAYALARLLTPLIKFRACRDARRVTGDAMEVRGGCGYIEEWPDPKLVRDAHLGSIWEGTSNIVALDVIRAAKREQSLPVFLEHVRELGGGDVAGLDDIAQRAVELAEAAIDDVSLTRSAASALYHVASAAGLAHEARELGLPHRLAVARVVVRHRLETKDPLAAIADEDSFGPLMDDPGAGFSVS